MPEIRISQPAVPTRQEPDLLLPGTEEIGFIVDDTTRLLIGMYGRNESNDTLRYELEIGRETYKLQLGPHETAEFRLPRHAHIRERVRLTRSDPLLLGRTLRESRVFPYTRLICERVYGNPRRSSPTVLSVTTTQFNADTTAHNCGLPATVDANDGLLIIFGMSNIDFAANLMTPPSGFTEKFDDQWDNSGERQGIGVFIKVAVGTEDGGTANVVTGTATSGSSHVYRIQAGTWSETTAGVEVSAKAEGDSANMNPPAHTPSGGSLDYLWIAAGCRDDMTTAASAAPTNYTNLTNTSGTGSARSQLATARRGLTASSEDPGTFTTGAEKWITITISIEPGAGGTEIESTEAQLNFDTSTTTLDLGSHTVQSTEAQVNLDTGVTELSLSGIAIQCDSSSVDFDSGETGVQSGGEVIQSSETQIDLSTGDTSLDLGQLVIETDRMFVEFETGETYVSAEFIGSAAVVFNLETESTTVSVGGMTIESDATTVDLDTGTTSLVVGGVVVESVSVSINLETGSTSLTVFIHSAESVFNLETGETQIILVPAPGTLGERRGPHYEAVLVERIPQIGSSPVLNVLDRVLELERIGWAKQLNGDGFGSVSTRPENLNTDIAARLRAPDENPLELWIYREDIKVYAGPIIGIQVQGASNTVTFHSRGLLYYLRYMFLTSDFLRTNVDKFVVVRDLIDHWQNQQYGHFGINTNSIGTSGDLISVDYKRTEIVNIGQAVSRLSNPEEANGFDFQVDPVTRNMILYDPQRGSDKTLSVILDNRVLEAYSLFMDLTAGDFATSVVAAATGFQLDGALWSQKTNSTRRQQFGYAGLGAQWNGVEIQATLDSYAQALVNTHSNFRLALGGGGGSDDQGGTRLVPVEGIEPPDIDPGDTVSVTADVGFGQFELQRDITEVNVSVSAGGLEEMNVGLL